MNTQNIKQLLYFCFFAVVMWGGGILNTSFAQTGCECRDNLSNVSTAESLHVPDSLTGGDFSASWSNPNASINGSGLSAAPTTIASLSTITHSQPTLTSDATYLTGNNINQPWTFNFNAPVDLSGAAIWIPCSNDYGGNDAPIKRFSLSSEVCGETFTEVFDLGEPEASADILNFTTPLLGVTSITLNILEVWEQTSGDCSVFAVGNQGTVLPTYNVTLGEIVFFNDGNIGLIDKVCEGVMG